MKNNELMKQYKAMVKDNQSFEGAIKSYLDKLAKSSPAFAAKYDLQRLDKCYSYIISCAREILGNRPGNVADEICYKMARDYFEDSLWNESETPKGSEAAPVDDEAEVAEAVETQKNAPALDVVPEKKLKKPDPIPEQLDLFGGV